MLPHLNICAFYWQLIHGTLFAPIFYSGAENAFLDKYSEQHQDQRIKNSIHNAQLLLLGANKVHNLLHILIGLF